MASLFCPVCGTENPPTRQFCRKCAADLRAPVPGPNASVEPATTSIPIRPILIGIGIAALLIALLLGTLALLGGSPASSPSPEPTASSEPASIPPASLPAPTTAETEAAPTEPTSPTEAPTEASLAPGESGAPVVDSFSGPRSASCTSDNGTGTVGMIRLKWTASNTPGVRLSIDPPTANTAYDYGYDDYEAIGTADLPFTCDPPSSDAGGSYHLYVATTVHDGGYFAWRFIKVYIKP